jgi:hypothetical protein
MFDFPGEGPAYRLVRFDNSHFEKECLSQVIFVSS